MDELVAKALNDGKADKTRADHPEGYLGGAYVAGRSKAPTPVDPLVSNAPRRRESPRTMQSTHRRYPCSLDAPYRVQLRTELEPFSPAPVVSETSAASRVVSFDNSRALPPHP